MEIALVAAVAENGVIGKDGDLPWHLPADLRHFMRTTQGHPIVMGRLTFDSLDAPLPRRTNVVLTSRPDYGPEGVVVKPTLRSALDHLAADHPETVFIVGGTGVFREALPLADRLELTRVHARVEGDTVFPPFDESEWRLVREEAHPADERHAFPFTFQRWERRR